MLDIGHNYYNMCNIATFFWSFYCSSAMYVKCLLYIQFDTIKDDQHGVKLHYNQINGADLAFFPSELNPVSSDDCKE